MIFPLLASAVVAATPPPVLPGARKLVAAAAALPAVPLTRSSGDAFSLAELRGRWVWLYLGYANCPSACPMALSYVADELRRLRAPERVQAVFVSVDPARDTPAKLATYTAYFHPGIIGATAPRDRIDDLVRALGASYKIYPPEQPGGDYVVGHPNTIFVIDPQGCLRATYDSLAGAMQPALANDFNALPAVAAAVGIERLAEPIPRPAPVSTTAEAWCGGDAQDPLLERAAALGSGTSVLPAAAPMRMWHVRAGNWLWMFHANALAGYDVQSGPRGDLARAAENWQMAMGSRLLGPGVLDLRAMTSLEPLTVPPGGTPQLFQTGETYRFQPLLDHQHPHDLVMELAGRYTWNLDARTAAFIYGGPAGEPALGPTAYMHRPSAADDAWAPLAHHLQDATHVSYGVATLGGRRDAFQLEASVFNGREPDEYRYDLETGPWTSYSARLSWFPGRNWALQASWGHLANPERLHPGDVNRTIASVLNVQDLPYGRLSTQLTWGQNVELHLPPFPTDPYALQSYGLEGQLDLEALHVYGRYELVDKDGLPPGPLLNHTVHRIDALTLGAVRDLGVWEYLNLGLGGDFTVYAKDAELANAYGFNPFSFRIYLRLRPPDMPRSQ